MFLGRSASGGGDQAAAAATKTPKTEAALGVAKQEDAKEVGEVTTGNNGGGLEVSMVQPGRELLAALKEVEELLSRAAEAGKEVSGKLEDGRKEVPRDGRWLMWLLELLVGWMDRRRAVAGRGRRGAGGSGGDP